MTQSSPSDALPLGSLKRVDAICANFETRWRAGEKPSIKDLLSEMPAADQAHLFRELLQTESELRAEQGLPPAETLYRRRFPQYAEIIAQVFHPAPAPTVAPQPTEAHAVIDATMVGSSERGKSTDIPSPARMTKSTAAKEARRRVGPYRILKALGRGGMGVVYLAQHEQLERQVAIKMIRTDAQVSDAQLARFQTEATAVARLQHPGVVQIFGMSKHKGSPYLILEYVPGGTLESRLAGQPLPARQAAAILVKLARAIQAAHAQGIIHRDLKPANILLLEPEKPGISLEHCTPKITDFGLAKHLDRSDLTETGQIMGTPDFMPPEQAKGQIKDVGPTADIYALGAILYSMLAGRPPFRGTSVIATLDLVCNQEPIPPRRFQADCPMDLETICLKCLEKSPGLRYAAAKDLADDLERFLNGQPVLARPIGVGGRSVRWAKRNPLASGLLAAVFLVCLLGTGVSTSLAIHASKRAREAEAATELAEQGQELARRAAEAETLSRERVEWLAYANQVCLAQREFERGRVTKANMVLDSCRLAQRHWEHAYLRQLANGKSRVLVGHAGAVNEIAVHPDGSKLVSAGADGVIRLWDLHSGTLVRLLTGPVVAMESVQFSPDGKRLAIADRSGLVRIQETSGYRELFSFQAHTGAAHSVRFHPAGAQIATSGADETVGIWNAADGALLARLNGHRGPVRRVAFNQDGEHLASGGTDGSVRVWRLRDAGQLLVLRNEPGVYDVAFSPDGQQLASAGEDRVVHVWSLPTGRKLQTLQGHTAAVRALVYSRDGKRLVTAGGEGVVKVWETVHGQDLLTLEGHADSVESVAFSPDGTRLLTGSADKTGRIWDARTRK